MRVPIELLVKKYKDNLFSAAFSICKNAQDAEDIVQETYLKYLKSKQDFESEQHIKAWLLRVTINQAKNIVLSFWKRNRITFQEYIQELPFETQEDSQVFDTVMSLPRKYRVVLHLFYFEDYSIREISEILQVKENTVKSQLARGRKLLKEKLKEAWNEDES